MTQKHQFALSVPSLQKLTQQGVLIVQDPETVMRITAILRLQVGESCVLFDAAEHIVGRIRSLSKKRVEFEIVERKPHTILQPKITCLLPLLKRDDLEAALYSAVELGAQVVQLLMTEKVQRSWGGAKELERLHRIMIAAAEQSKNFSLPELRAPIELMTALQRETSHSAKLFFDVNGAAPAEIMQKLVFQKSHELTLLIGPEGDLTDAEKASVVQQGFVTCSLTPTILRAASAFALGLGLVRSYLK